MPLPKIGDILQYRVSVSDLVKVQVTRLHFVGGVVPTTGAILPLIVTHVWPDFFGLHDDAINGNVFLDGADSFWVDRRQKGTADGQWQLPA